MQEFREVSSLIRKDVKLEWRHRSAIQGVVLYLASTLFVCYLGFSGQAQPDSLVPLFWIILLFAATNAASRSHITDSDQQHYTYFQLVSPAALILAKLVYNGLLMLVLGGVSYLLFSIFMGNLVTHTLLFFPVLILGCLGFSSLMTLVSAMSTRSGNNFTMTAVLGFPISLPLVTLCVRLTQNCINSPGGSSYYENILILAALDVVIIGLAYILFPFIWRD